MNPAAAFDRLAASYDERWTNAPAGRLQRDQVWRFLDPLIQPGMRVLDLGCGTGEDAVHFMARGAHVDAIDASPGMVRIARSRGVNAATATVEDLAPCAYDAVLSNFGVLNCVGDVSVLHRVLSASLRRGGLAALCLLNRFCAWETAHYLARGKWRKALRRARPVNRSSLGVDVFYHSTRRMRASLHPEFALLADYGIGVAVPPSYVRLTRLTSCARIDYWIGPTLIGRALADHRLLLFVRN